MSNINLEERLHILQLARESRLHEMPPARLEKQTDLLVAYAIEEEVRPKLLSHLTNRKVLLEYLSLSEENKEQVFDFYEEHPDCISGKKNHFSGPGKSLDVLRKQRISTQLLAVFDEFMKKRKQFNVFSYYYLIKSKNGSANYQSWRRLQSDNEFKELIDFVADERSEIKKYSDRASVVKIVGVQELERIFDTFLKRRVPFETFSTTYLLRRTKDGRNLYNKAQRSLHRGFRELWDLACEQNPDIELYSDNEKLFRIEGPSRLVKVFDQFLKKRKPYEVFNGIYLRYKLQDEGPLLLSKSYHFLEGGFDEFCELAAQQRPEMKEYLSYSGVFRKDAPRDLIKLFDEFMKHREQNDQFNTGYLDRTKKGKTLFVNSHNCMSGIQELVELAAEQRPEILKYWKYKPYKSRGLNAT